MFLQGVPLPWDVSYCLLPSTQPHSTALSLSRVGLFGLTCHDLQDHSLQLWSTTDGASFLTFFFLYGSLADYLIYSSREAQSCVVVVGCADWCQWSRQQRENNPVNIWCALNKTFFAINKYLLLWSHVDGDSSLIAITHYSIWSNHHCTTGINTDVIPY